MGAGNNCKRGSADMSADPSTIGSGADVEKILSSARLNPASAPHPPCVGVRPQVRCLPAAQSDHAEIAREALVQITHKVLTRKK